MNEQIKDGGPAFPSNYEFDSIDHIPPGEIGVSQRVAVSTPGMTLRDYFAAKAMQAHIAAAWSHPAPSQNGFREWKADLPPDAGEPRFTDWIAYMANLSADAMLAAREVKA